MQNIVWPKIMVPDRIIGIMLAETKEFIEKVDKFQ